MLINMIIFAKEVTRKNINLDRQKSLLIYACVIPPEDLFNHAAVIVANLL